VYHLELRQFPHNFRHFNLTEQALRETVLDAWTRDEWIEVGERKWNAQQASLTVIEGPALPVEQLSMGRGWSNALRQGTDVTAQLLASARARLGVGTAASPPTGGSEAGSQPPLEETLARQLLSILGENPGPLLRAWQLALEQHPDRSPSQCLASAEDFVRH
jgi:hypothetical protein